MMLYCVLLYNLRYNDAILRSTGDCSSYSFLQLYLFSMKTRISEISYSTDTMPI